MIIAFIITHIANIIAKAITSISTSTTTSTTLTMTTTAVIYLLLLLVVPLIQSFFYDSLPTATASDFLRPTHDCYCSCYYRCYCLH